MKTGIIYILMYVTNYGNFEAVKIYLRLYFPQTSVVGLGNLRMKLQWPFSNLFDNDVTS
jgi:hypothetical protein